MKVLEGWKTYIAAIGLMGLAVFQLSTAQFEGAMQSMLAALAAFGIRSALKNVA